MASHWKILAETERSTAPTGFRRSLRPRDWNGSRVNSPRVQWKTAGEFQVNQDQLERFAGNLHFQANGTPVRRMHNLLRGSFVSQGYRGLS